LEAKKKKLDSTIDHYDERNRWIDQSAEREKLRRQIQDKTNKINALRKKLGMRPLPDSYTSE